MKTMKISYCVGEYPNSGKAIYLDTDLDENGEPAGGYRIAGHKCYGFIQTVKAFDLGEDDLKNLIDQAKVALKSLKQYNKKNYPVKRIK